MKSRVYRLTPVEVSVRHSLFCSMEWTSGKKKTYLRSQRKEEKDLGKVTRLRVQRMPGKSAAVRISAFMDMYDCFQNTVGKVDM